MKNELRDLKVKIVKAIIKQILLCLDAVTMSFTCVYFFLQC